MFLANTHSKGYNNTKVLLIITLTLVKSTTGSLDLILGGTS